MSKFSFLFILSLIPSLFALVPSQRLIHQKLKMSINENFLSSSSLPLAELYSSPTARYNGELIDKSLKLVEPTAKPEGYVYGAVSQDATPILAITALFSVFAAAAVPYFLAIGDTAKRQQEEREESSSFKPRFSKTPSPAVKKSPTKKGK